MITGPSIGPAMVLNILMRWPALIIVCGVGGTGTLVYKNVPEAQAAIHAVFHGDEVRAVQVSAQVPPATEERQSPLIEEPVRILKTNLK